MRKLFDIDMKNYSECTHSFRRDSARSIIIKNKKIAMVHSLKYDYYKFPGGGIEINETPIEAMIRETREETGLIVIKNTIKEYGYVHRIQKSSNDVLQCFIQDNYYYFCDVEDYIGFNDLDNYEKEENYRLEYVFPSVVIRKNRNIKNCPHDSLMLEREALVIELLISEGYLD